VRHVPGFSALLPDLFDFGMQFIQIASGHERGVTGRQAGGVKAGNNADKGCCPKRW
jgi:hypothetical protein